MVIADANAILVSDRVLAQHQAALSLIRQLTQDPRKSEVFWLDLACGRGQILSNIEKVIPENRRKKISYIGFDVSKKYALQAENRAKRLFANARVEICDLQRFESYLEGNDLFDVVTLTNTVHEINPDTLSETFVAALSRTNGKGCLYVYDMERLPDLEVGAIPWSGAEIQQIINDMLKSVGVDEEAFPDVATWPHKSCACWNLQLHREHIDLFAVEGDKRKMIQAGSGSIKRVLENKLFATHSLLETASRYGIENVGDKREVQHLLNDFWAISRALGSPVTLYFRDTEVSKC